MATISYLHLGLEPFRIKVMLDGKYVGNIRRTPKGYFYRTKAGHEGEHFATVEAVKESIEG